MDAAAVRDWLAIAVSVVELTQQRNDSGVVLKRKVDDAQELVRFALQCRLDDELGLIFDRAEKNYKQAYCPRMTGRGYFSSMKVGSIDVFRFQPVRLFFSMEAGVQGNVLTILQEPFDRFSSVPPGSTLRPRNFAIPSPDAVMPADQAPFKRLQVTAGGHNLTVDQLHPDVAVESHEQATLVPEGDPANRAPPSQNDTGGFIKPPLPDPNNRPIKTAKSRRAAQPGTAAASREIVLVPDSQAQSAAAPAPTAAHALRLRAQAATGRPCSMPITQSSPAEELIGRANTIAPQQRLANPTVGVSLAPAGDSSNDLNSSTDTHETLPTPDYSEERRKSHDQQAPTSAQQPRPSHAPLSEQTRRFINPNSADDMALQDPIEDHEDQYLDAMDDNVLDAGDDYEYLPTGPVQRRGRTRSRSLESVPPERNASHGNERSNSNQRNRTQGSGGQAKLNFPRDKQKGAVGPAGPALRAELDRQYRRAPAGAQRTSEQRTSTEPASRLPVAPSTARSSTTNTETMPRSSSAFDELRSSQTARSSSRRGTSTTKWSRDEDIAVLRGMKWKLPASKVIKLFHLERTESALRNRRKILLETFAGGKVPAGHDFYAEVEQSPNPARGVASTVSSSQTIAQPNTDRPNEPDRGDALATDDLATADEVNINQPDSTDARPTADQDINLNELGGDGALAQTDEDVNLNEVDGGDAIGTADGDVNPNGLESDDVLPTADQAGNLNELDGGDALATADHDANVNHLNDGALAAQDKDVDMFKASRRRRKVSPQVVIPPIHDHDEGGVDDLDDELYAVSVDGNVQDQPGPASPQVMVSPADDNQDEGGMDDPADELYDVSVDGDVEEHQNTTPKKSRKKAQNRRLNANKKLRKSESLRGASSAAINLPVSETEVAPVIPSDPEPEAMDTQENGDEIPFAPSQSAQIVTGPHDLRTPLTEPDANGCVLIGRREYPVRMALESIYTDDQIWNTALRLSKGRRGLAKTQYEHDWLGFQAYVAMSGRDWDEQSRLLKKMKRLKRFLAAKRAGKVGMNANFADWEPDRPHQDGSVDEEYDSEDGSGDEENESDEGEFYDAEEEAGAVLPDADAFPNGVERGREFEEVVEDEEEPANTTPAARNTTSEATNGRVTNGPTPYDPANTLGLTPSALRWEIPPAPRPRLPPPSAARLPYPNSEEDSSSSGSSQEDVV